MLSRRKMLARLRLGAGAAVGAVLAPAFRAQGAGGDHRHFAAQAAAMRAKAVAVGDQPYGAIVVKEGRIVGLGPSRVVEKTDPTAHAEMEALRDAARNLQTHDLAGCEMFTTSPPCRMCETAAYWANIRRIYSGATARDGGKPRYGC